MAEHHIGIPRGPIAAVGDRQLAMQESVNRFTDDRQKFDEFFKTFTSPGFEDVHWGNKKYRILLQSIYDGKSSVLPVSVDDLKQEFESYDDLLLSAMENNARRYVELLYEAADVVLKDDSFAKRDVLVGDDESERGGGEDVAQNDLSRKARERREEAMTKSNVPPHMRCSFEIQLIPSAKSTTKTLRAVNADCVGSFVSLEANVVRTTAVKPCIQVAAYECDVCSCKAYKAVEGSTFMPLFDCPQEGCKALRRSNTLKFQLKHSKFVKYQEVKVQEPAIQVPQGDVPRSLSCIISGEMTRQLLPGMSVTLSGVLMPIAKFGYAAMRSGTLAETIFEVHHVENNKKGYSEEMFEKEEILRQVEEAKQGENLYERLAFSIAPEIYGNQDVKKALLLQLIGGVGKEKKDGGMIRGDIHILLMGDPGVAKSQLMKQVCSIAPRSVYTTGKGSSSVGLTAAVCKDPNTGETALEGGALVLADQGICCIDEFDKMDEYDRSAIYEVMEQQTVSIAKAGHCSTLPARSAVLAAANPVDGKYDLRKSVLANMNLPAALLTRFDLQFLLLDLSDREKDMQLAKYVLAVMRGAGAVDQRHEFEPLEKKVLRCFIALARELNPVLPEDLVPVIAEYYVNAREAEKQQEKGSVDDRKNYTTPRALLAVLRLSQALARLRGSLVIEAGDFEEALRLSQESKRSVMMTEDLKKKRRKDFRSDILELLRRMRTLLKNRNAKWNGWIPLSEVELQTVTMGFKKTDLETTLEEYVELTVLLLNNKKTYVAFADDVGEGSEDEMKDADEEEDEDDN